jgi:hypothetical protein
MMKRAGGADHAAFIECLGKVDSDLNQNANDAAVEKAFETLGSDFFSRRETPKAVLGIDIYQYSRFPENKQRLVPIIFDILYDAAVKWCQDHEPAFFNAQSLNDFISTGDGGFQILESPLQGLLFAAMFQTAITSYDKGTIQPCLGRLVGELTLRYTLTYDRVFKLDNEWYGPAIIRNARILSRDKLNRCLADENSVEWFRKRIGTLDSLSLLKRNGFRQVGAIDPDARGTLLFDEANAFRSVNVQRVGSVKVKESDIDIYNIYAQVAVTAGNDKNDRWVVALGNLNAGGITVE